MRSWQNDLSLDGVCDGLSSCVWDVVWSGPGVPICVHCQQFEVVYRCEKAWFWTPEWFGYWSETVHRWLPVATIIAKWAIDTHMSTWRNYLPGIG